MNSKVYLLTSLSKDKERSTVFYAYNILADAIKWVEDVDPSPDAWDDQTSQCKMYTRKRIDYPGEWQILVMEIR